MDFEQKIERVFVLPKEEIVEELRLAIVNENGRPPVIWGCVKLLKILSFCFTDMCMLFCLVSFIFKVDVYYIVAKAITKNVAELKGEWGYLDLCEICLERIKVKVATVQVICENIWVPSSVFNRVNMFDIFVYP